MNKNLQFIAFGDWGANTFFANMNTHNVQKIKDLNFYLLLGDNFYPNGVETIHDKQWHEKFIMNFNQEIPSFVILGNHDYIQNPQCQIQYSRVRKNWEMPFFYYDFVIHTKKKNSCHFIMIDTCLLAEDVTLYLLKNTNASESSINNYLTLVKKYRQKQMDWIEKILRKSRCQWKFVCGHYPLFSSGPHIISVQLRNFLVPLLEKYKVDFYISGHDHNLQHLVKNNVNYVISGGFSSFYPTNNLPNEYSRFVSDSAGFVSFELNDAFLSMDFKSLDNSTMYNSLFSKLQRN